MMNCWKENPQDRPSFYQLKELMEEMIQKSSCSASFQLEVMTNSEYHSMETDDTSDGDDTSDSGSSSDENNNGLRDEQADDIDDTNGIDCLDDVFQPDKDDRYTDRENSDGGATTSNRQSLERKAKVKKRKKKRQIEVKAPRPKKLDSMRDSTCSHDELLPPSPCSPETNTNVCFECEL